MSLCIKCDYTEFPIEVCLCKCGSVKNSLFKYCESCAKKINVCEACGKDLDKMGIEENTTENNFLDI